MTDNHSSSSTFTFFDKETGQMIGKFYNQLTSTITWLSENTSPVNIGESYNFRCECDLDNPETIAYREPWKYHYAHRVAGKLNDLIEEYHAPGTARRERRAIKREFDRFLRILQQHCHKYKIDIQFTRT